MRSNHSKSTDFPFAWIVILALLAVPRVVAHDLKWVQPGSLMNSLLVFIPPLLWIGFVLWKKPARPFTVLLFVGVCYGVLLGITHQLLWNFAFEKPPTLGGNLAGIPSAANNLIVRSFSFISSLVTGTVIGAITGIIAAFLSRLRS